EVRAERAPPRRAVATWRAATASNPLTIASWAALFAAASVAGAADTPASAVALLVGAGVGSGTTRSATACGGSFARGWAGPRLLRTVDAVAGTGLLGFAGVLGYR